MMNNEKQIAEEADMIVNGYAFKKINDIIHVCNLNALQRRAILNMHSQMIETSMEDIEVAIVERIYRDNREFMEIS